MSIALSALPHLHLPLVVSELQVIETAYGSTLEWFWGLAGKNLTLRIHKPGSMPVDVTLNDKQVEELVKVLCFKIAGEYVPHSRDGKAKVAITHNAAQWALRSIWTCDAFKPGERVDHAQRSRDLGDAKAEIRAALLAAGGKE